MVRRLEVAIELAKKDKVAFDAKMKDKTYRAEIEQKRLRILEADKAKKARMKEMMDKATSRLWPKGEYDEAETFAKMAQEIDPNEVAADDPRLQGQDRTALQDRPGEPRPEGRRRRHRLPGGRRRRRSPTPRSSSRASSSPRTSRT